MGVMAAAALDHSLGPSRIAFYSTLAVVNTFVIGAVVFNFRTEDKQPLHGTVDQLLFILPTLLLVASETFALSALYFGRDNHNIVFTTQLLTTVGSGIFFVFLATRIIDPKGGSTATDTAHERARGFYVLLFALSIAVPLFFLAGLPGHR